jgi:ubiquinone/menaquinone biosynthesis C-methylase UbiE
MVARAKKEISQILKTQEHTSFAQGDVKHLDFPDGYFDIVIGEVSIGTNTCLFSVQHRVCN